MSEARRSPSGLLVCESEGPLDASVVLIAESPAKEEMAHKPVPRPLVGRAGRVLDLALSKAGLPRATSRVMNLVPVRAPKDKFAMHDPRDVEWGREVFASELAALKQAKVYVALGANPLKWLVGDLPVSRHRDKAESDEGSGGAISMWRGSVLPVDELRARESTAPEDYLPLLGAAPHAGVNAGGFIIPTFHPSAIARQFSWHPWLINDLRIARRVAAEGRPELPRRKWFINEVSELPRFVEEVRSTTRMVSFDTESEPVWIVGLASDTEVHVFEFVREALEPLRVLLTDPEVVKIAHNWAHDFAFSRLNLDISVKAKIADPMGNANVLDSSLRKSLSPHITTRWGPGWKWEGNHGVSVGWPHHKWLDDHDPLVYCGLDCVAAYDSHWPQVEELMKRKLYGVVTHDTRLLMPLMDMQRFGFRVNETVRKETEAELLVDLQAEKAKLAEMVAPIIAAKLEKFVKPHLFRVKRKCPCCGGGSTQAQHCATCHMHECDCMSPPEGTKEEALAHQKRTIKEFKESWPVCVTCGGTGKVDKDLEFNPDSPDQLADVIYRGLGVKARTYKGSETVRVGQLEPLAAKYPVVAQAVVVSRQNAEYETIARLTAGRDGRLHCVQDPFGTVSGRVAGKEGLLEVGTNPMNIPKKARRFVVPDPDHVLLYPDMAQIELRAIGALAATYGDRSLLDLILLADDKEAWVAKGFPLKAGAPDLHLLVRDDTRVLAQWAADFSRDQAKRLEYGSFYGGRPEQLAKELTDEALRKGEGARLNADQMQVIIDKLLNGRFKAVKAWRDGVEAEILRTRELRSPTGRVFHFHGYTYDKKTKGVSYEVLKQAWSRQPQDMAAWVLADGLIDLWNSEYWGKLIRPLIHVHDAVLMQTHRSTVEEAQAVGSTFLTRTLWGMKFPSEMKTGMNWAECS